MEKWSLNDKTIIVNNITLQGDILESLSLPINKRTNFSYNDKEVIIPRYFYRIIGIEGEQEDYYNDLFDINIGLENYKKLYLHINNKFEDKIESNLLTNLNTLWNKIISIPDVSSKDIVNLIEQMNLLMKFPNKILSQQIRNNLKGIIDYYSQVNNHSVDGEELKKLIFNLINWINKYVGNLFVNFDYKEINPKVLYYGDISKIEIYFLLYLSSLGCDIVYFNPLREIHFWEVDPKFLYSNRFEFEKKTSIKPFPTKKIVTRASTLAFGASQEIEEVLHTEDSLNYKPWQLINYEVETVTLKTIYDELYILGKEQAKFRHQWEVKKGIAYIPNIFAKVNGTHKDKEKYWEEIDRIIKLPNTLLFKNLPIINIELNEINNRTNWATTYGGRNHTEHYDPNRNAQNFAKISIRYKEYWEIADRTGKIKEDKIINSNWWPYNDLPSHIQKLIANRITTLPHKSIIKTKGFNSIEEYQATILTVLLNIPKEFTQLMQKFDYPKDVPKIIIYNNETNGKLEIVDAILLAFLNSLGMDIIVYNPASHNDIENYLDEKLYDIHRLEDVSFNLEYKEISSKSRSLFSRFFS